MSPSTSCWTASHAAAIATGVFPVGGTRPCRARGAVHGLQTDIRDNGFRSCRAARRPWVAGSGHEEGGHGGGVLPRCARSCGRFMTSGRWASRWRCRSSTPCSISSSTTSMNTWRNGVSKGQRVMTMLAQNLAQGGTPSRSASAPACSGISSMGGRRRGRSGQSFDNLTPVDNSVLGAVAAGSAAGYRRGRGSGPAAFPAWREHGTGEAPREPAQDRRCDRGGADEIALVESIDTGQAIRFEQGARSAGRENFRFFADRVRAGA